MKCVTIQWVLTASITCFSTQDVAVDVVSSYLHLVLVRSVSKHGLRSTISSDLMLFL